MLFFELTGNGFSKTLCKDALLWYVSKFLPRHKLEIIVNHRGLKREFVYGWCSVLDCDYRPRSFQIEIQSNLDRETYLKTLFHELQHVYQHVSGNLRDKKQKRYWKGIDYNHLDCEDLPWEKEAHKMEKILYKDYIKSK